MEIRVLIRLFIVVVISFAFLGCSNEPLIQTTIEINPLDQTKITEMIIERADKKIVIVTDPQVIGTVIDKLSKIKVSKLSPEQEKNLLDNHQKNAAGYSYNLILKDEAQETKSYAVLLFNTDNKALMLIDVKTMLDNKRTVSYANIDARQTSDYIQEIYNIATEETYKDFLKKAKEKGIIEVMISTLGNLGYSEEEILKLSKDELARIFAPGTHLDGGGFDPNEQQKIELAEKGIDTSMSVILYNLGYEYEEMLELSNEEIDFIFPNTELIANLVARGYNEQDVQTWAIRKSGKTYKDIIKEAMKKSEVESKFQFTFYPSGPDFIKTIIDYRGSVELTEEMRKLFNNFARDYRFIYLPDMNYYDSFFEANQYAESFGYNNFGFAVFYVLQYLKCPEKINAEAMQNFIQSMFVAKESYQDMKHQAFPKLANYENGHYSPWPEGGLDHNRMFYLLTGLNIIQKETDIFYINIRCQSYYFEHPTYEPGENEKWLLEKSEELGIADLQVAEEFIMSGEIAEELEASYEYEITIYVDINENGYNPRFVSNNSRSI